jgi:hypothetical protein
MSRIADYYLGKIEEIADEKGLDAEDIMRRIEELSSEAEYSLSNLYQKFIEFMADHDNSWEDFQNITIERDW